MAPLFDTHCHLDAGEFDSDRETVIARAQAAGLRGLLIPAVHRSNFSVVRDLAHAMPIGAYAVGIHPLFVARSERADLKVLAEFLDQHRDDPRLVAVGEIGLDFFVESIREGVAREEQIHFYREQLALARAFDLPVLLHVRRSQDELLKWLRRMPPMGGLAHAFNGSFQQAEQFIGLGFALGMGGALTFARARQIRRLATELSLSDLVLETDAPDIGPSWLTKGQRNEPAEVAQIAASLAQLREVSVEVVINQTAQAAFKRLPKLAKIWPQPSAVLSSQLIPSA
jgi:TatD DNase family protein